MPVPEPPKNPDLTGESYALSLDAIDPLAHFRERFHIPPNTVYLERCDGGQSNSIISR
jgi:kynureninase